MEEESKKGKKGNGKERSKEGRKQERDKIKEESMMRIKEGKKNEGN